VSIRNLEFSTDEYYHIYNRGVERRQLFLNESEYKRFITLLYTANSTESIHLSNYKGVALKDIPVGKPIVAVGAWCLMPNHFHLLVKEIEEGGISHYLHKLSTGYSMYFNTKHHRKGALFEGPFKARHLDCDQYLKYGFTYTHLNPISLVDSGWKNKRIEDKKKAKDFLDKYEYSSYLDYCGVERPEGKILNREAFPEYFETVNDFQEMINEWINFKEGDDNINIKASP
jgi:putative transposase